ncbi:MAG: SprT-like domain-containing protein [Cyclobacteriaceae bacterium]|nr:SprT-like domain-containing protein [Cyclobacteriaceae bacterium HetDA_MAG_MS6]
MNRIGPAEVFKKFVPSASIEYCLSVYNHFGFEFKIKRGRQTKLGDFRHDSKTGKSTISINNDLNPYSFLITYLHEVAHLVTFNEHKWKVQPHGVEWKANFKRVLQPVLNTDTFPAPVLNALHAHLKNPKASSCSDPTLYSILKQYDQPSDNILLKNLNVGDSFEFNSRKFKKLEKKRTRSVCLEMSTGRRYLISEIAAVEKLE